MPAFGCHVLNAFTNHNYHEFKWLLNQKEFEEDISSQADITPEICSVLEYVMKDCSNLSAQQHKCHIAISLFLEKKIGRDNYLTLLQGINSNSFKTNFCSSEEKEGEQQLQEFNRLQQQVIDAMRAATTKLMENVEKTENLYSHLQKDSSREIFLLTFKAAFSEASFTALKILSHDNSTQTVEDLANFCFENMIKTFK